MWNKDEVQGKGDRIKGQAKQKIADLNHDEDLRSEGEAEEAGGKAQEAVGKARRKVGDAIKDIGRKVGH